MLISFLSPFTAPVEPSDPTKARITGVSFGGSSGLNVDLSVDGGDNNDDYIHLFNRQNPGNNYVPDISALPTPVNNIANATAFCLNPACTQTKPITSLNQLRVPAGALGDFFGPGTTVGVPFAAQFGLKLTF